MLALEIKYKKFRKIFIKFFLLLAIFLGYFLFMGYKYGISQGFLVAALSWSFFVLCTPIADGGFLIDFPFRLITRVKMYISEIMVWIIAISLNVYTFFFNPEIYQKTELLSFFKNILSRPIPFWSIIFLSLIGTFVSIIFGDKLFDSFINNKKNKTLESLEIPKHNRHKNIYSLVIPILLFILVFVLYGHLLKQLGIKLPI